MSGHSKWATIRRKKDKTDQARGRAFSKLIKEITIAARMGGGDPGGNPRLRQAIDAGKAANMPAGNIERAVQKGTGELEGVHYEDVTYEAYGPGGTALLIEVTTDNRNRCVSELRHIISRHGGNLGEAGSVNWMFQRRGQIGVPASGVDEDTLMMAALDAGAEDMKLDEDFFQIVTDPDALEPVKKALTAAGFKVENSALVKLPQTFVPVNASQGRQILKLVESLEEHDDVRSVWSNCDLPEEVMAE